MLSSSRGTRDDDNDDDDDVLPSRREPSAALAGVSKIRVQIGSVANYLSLGKLVMHLLEVED